jgi:hypothetical protein
MHKALLPAGVDKETTCRQLNLYCWPMLRSATWDECSRGRSHSQ